MSKKVLITGGAGFIGSAVCRRLVQAGWHVTNLDCLTYAGNLNSLTPIADAANYEFVRLDICDREGVSALLAQQGFDAIMHLAAESHVDRSIDGPGEFVRTNVTGTFEMLEAARQYWTGLDDRKRADFRFHHISTDEVFGDLPFDSGFFFEDTPYAPSSPYSASKAASDHFVRAWHETYGLPVVLSNCSNNYGPYQFPEKLIPLVTLNALEDRPLPVYGTGANVRDWLHVEDHAAALQCVLEDGVVGESYNVGGRAERTNLQVVQTICDVVDRLSPRPDNSSRRDLIEFVSDRPGHDRRYAIDCTKIEQQLGWTPDHSFEKGLEETVRWYLDNEAWWQPLRQKLYSGARLGEGKAQ